MKNRVKKWFIFFAVSQLMILLTACEIGNANKGNEPEWRTDLESRRHAVNVLEDTHRIVLQKAEVMWENVENLADLAGRLARRAMDLPKERESIRVIYPSEWYDDPYVEKCFPEGVIREIADAFRANSLMEFIDAHSAEYKILSREEIEKYAVSSDTVYNFIEEMEWTNSHMVVTDETPYEKREEKIREISETDAIWYMLPLDLRDSIVVYGKYETYKFDLRGFEWGFSLSFGMELYFISWDEDNLVIEADENWERISVHFFDGIGVGNVAAIEKDADGEPVIDYYEVAVLMK